MTAAKPVEPDGCASCALIDLCGVQGLIDLVGPKGYRHGFICEDPAKCGHRGGGPVSARAHTGRMVSRTVRGASTQAAGGRMSASELADRATHSITGRKASDYQHLAAARLHAKASRMAGSANIKAHHNRLAAMHRGIAQRNVGKQTSTENKARLARTNVFKSGSHGGYAARQDVPTLQKLAQGKDAKMAEAARKELAMRRGKTRPPAPAALRSGESRAPSTGKEQGPNVGELGKASYGSHRLPTGSKALTKEGRQKAYSHGHAISPPPGGGPPGFPVTSPKSWDDARKAVGRAGSPARRAALRDLLRRTAAQYGKTAALKKSWAASNTRPGLELAMTMPRYPVASPYDVLIIRSEDGDAIVRHRRGGYEIGRIKRGEDGAWVASRDGTDGQGHTRQRGALLELIGTHNRASGSPYHRPEPARTGAPLQPPPVTTPLMAQYGITNVRALANSVPVRGAGDGPRSTEPGGDGQTGRGLSPAGQRIYGQLRKRNFPHARAHAFARRAQRRVKGK